jgi:hypothetical protein
MNIEQWANSKEYIEHEVKIRVLKETTDCKFTSMQKNFDDKFGHLDYKINLLIGIAVFALLMPVIKSAFGVM